MESTVQLREMFAMIHIYCSLLLTLNIIKLRQIERNHETDNFVDFLLVIAIFLSHEYENISLWTCIVNVHVSVSLCQSL